MDILIKAGQLLLSLTLLVFIHELGHFLAAKAFKIRVNKFYVFFDFLFPIPSVLNFSLFKFKRGDTEYGLGWFPLGGYVQIAGMVDETMDKEALNAPPQPWEFRSKPAWQRLIVMIGGIVMNIVTGILIFSFWLGKYQKQYLPPSAMDTGIYAYELAKKQGLQTGDRIILVNDKPVSRFRDMVASHTFFGGKFTVERLVDGHIETKEIKLPKDFFRYVKGGAGFIAPFYQTVSIGQIVKNSHAEKAGLIAEDKIITVNGKAYNNFAHFQELLNQSINQKIELGVDRAGQIISVYSSVDTAGKIGFLPKIAVNKQKYALKEYSFLETLKYGCKESYNALITNAVALTKLNSNNIRESVSSPIGIANVFGGQWDWSRFWFLTATISIVLAFMNFLPIPALDGGHILFLLLEIIMRRPVPQKVLEIAQTIGTILLLAIMAFAFGNDILKIFGI